MTERLNYHIRITNSKKAWIEIAMKKNSKTADQFVWLQKDDRQINAFPKRMLKQFKKDKGFDLIRDNFLRSRENHYITGLITYLE